MSDNEPRFSSGNASFRHALNPVVAFARRHGVNPKGRTGWSQTADGWVPPVFRSSESGIYPFDLVNNSDGGYDVYSPIIISGRDDVTSFVATSGDGLIPDDDSYLVATIESLTTPAVVFEVITTEDWTSFPNCYEFSETPPFGMSIARIPIWHFTTDAPTEKDYTKFSDGDGDTVYGVKLVPSQPLRVYYGLALNSVESIYTDVIDLI